MSQILPWGKIFKFIENRKWHFKNGNFYPTPSSRTPITSQVLSDCIAEFRSFISDTDLVEKYSAFLQTKQNEIILESVVYDEPIDLIKAFVEHKNVVVGGRGDTLRIGNQMSSIEDVNVKLRNYTEAYNSQLPRDENGKLLANIFKPTFMMDTLEEHLIDMDLEYRNSVCKKLSFDGTDANMMVLKLLDIMSIKTDPSLSCDAFKHWMWLVKRRLLGRQINDELMLSIMAEQGVGKSYITRALAEPLGDYYIESDLSALADNREVGKWSKYFIINFEELSKSNGGHANGHFPSSLCETIKKILTQEEFIIRAMRSHKQFKHLRTFTALATTNISIVDVLGDETGMRRFYQIESSQPAHEQFNHEDVANFDFLALWKSIDENLARGYLFPTSKNWDKLKEVQKTYIPKTQIDIWLSDGPHTAGDETNFTECALVMEIYQHFRAFCEDAGIGKNFTMGVKKFKEKIQDYLKHTGVGDNKKYYLKEREQ